MSHNSQNKTLTNRLIKEKSPYLLQHAHNPVDWYPWGEAAFSRAAADGKPVFLSIGYSTCHWCHVMEKESFEDPEVAKVINRLFVPVKVDREERPDIDNTYMNICQMVTGTGGWPLNIFLTPDKKPIYTATYIPKVGNYGSPGIISLMERISEVWKNDREKIERSGNQLVDALRQIENTPHEELPLNDEPLKNALHFFKNSYDALAGGFGQAPKFPMAHNFLLLFRLWKRFGNDQARDMALETLRAIRNGGIYDQLGGGLHRYSVDPKWLIPHFEKMLYDQAILVLAVVEAFQITGDPFFSETAENTLDYVLNNLAHSEGAFFCGEDADSEGSEGIYYLWDREEVLKVLGHDAGEIFCQAFGVTPEGNFEGRNILYRSKDPADIAKTLGFPLEDLAVSLQNSRQILLSARERRERPFLDDKILSGWNGIAIAALCRAGSTLGRADLIQAARKCAEFVLQELYDGKGKRLLRRWRDGDAAIPAFLEDYSFFIWGLIELYSSTFEERYLSLALKLTKEMEALFSDGKNGFFDTAGDAETILSRGKNLQDTALPSGASAAVLNLVRLARLTGSQTMSEKGEKYLAALYSEYLQHPFAYPFLLTALDWVLGPDQELVLVSPNKEIVSEKLCKSFYEGFFPRTVCHGYSSKNSKLEELVPAVRNKPLLDGLPTAYVCSNNGCQPPTTKAEEMLRLLKQRRP